MSSAPSALELQRQRFQAAEQQDGVRFSWNIWPPSRIDATRIVLPLGCVYTPLRQKMARVVSYEPLMCGGGTWSSRANFGRQSDDRKNECDGALNPFCKVDFRTKHWTCNFCGRLNQFPGFYAERISEQALPLECQLSSIEYLLPQVAHQGGTATAASTPDAPIFVFVLDVALNSAEDEAELEKAKDAIQQALARIPPHARVGFISYGKLVHVWELAFQDLSKSYAFNGAKLYGAEAIASQLHLGSRGAQGSASTYHPFADPGDFSNNQNNMDGFHKKPVDPSGGVGSVQQQRPAQSSSVGSRFLLPIGECEFVLNGVIDDLGKDLWPREGPRSRVYRSTGAALSLAVSLVEQYVHETTGGSMSRSSFAPPSATWNANGSAGASLFEVERRKAKKNISSGQGSTGSTPCSAPRFAGARIFLLTSGPCTHGPGSVVDLDKSEPMRSWHDVLKQTSNVTDFLPAAQKVYSDIAQRAAYVGAGIDLFGCSLDQLGVLEMRDLCEKTGGLLCLADSFSSHVFRDTLLRQFDDSLWTDAMLGLNARISLLTSGEVKVAGAVGNCCGTGKAHSSVSTNEEIGEGSTNEWAAGVLDSSSSLCFFFEKAMNRAEESVDEMHLKAGYIQFQTAYNDPNGQRRVRITTVARGFACPALTDISHGFDDEAAAVVLARYAVSLLSNPLADSADVVRKVDRSLIRLASRFANYNKGDVASFHLPEELVALPQFVYNLRRSQFLNHFNCSPDESAFYRASLFREAVSPALLMIQPSLVEYSFEAPMGRHVLLDSKSLKSKVLLLLDCYFHVVVWRGETIQQWCEAGYHEKEEHANLKELLENPARDALYLLRERSVVPKFIQTYANGSQARFLMNRVNPNAGDVVTEDVGLKGFMESLINFCVSGEEVA